MFVFNECAKWKHLDMETNPSIVDITTTLDAIGVHLCIGAKLFREFIYVTTLKIQMAFS